MHPLRFLVEVALALFAAWQVVRLFWIFAARLTYPLDLEWMEGGTLYEAYRILHGQPLYETPVTTWAPYPYPPAHPLLLAITGCLQLDFWSGRLVSIFFFALLCFTIFREIHAHLERSAAGLTLATLTLAVIANAYPVVGQWYDLVRGDIMMLSLCVVGTARLLRPMTSWRQTLITALLFTAAIYTKQTAAAFVAWGCAFAIVRAPRAGLRLSALVAGLCSLVLVVLQWSSHGAFWYLTVSSLSQHEVRPAAVVEGFTIAFRYAPFLVSTPFLLLLAALKGRVGARSVLWVGAFFVALPASLIPYGKIGAYLNALLPLIVLSGPAFALVLADVSLQRGLVPALARWAALATLGQTALAHPLEPKSFVPDRGMRRAAHELNALVASLEGGVVAPYLGFLPARNGHGNPHWQTMVVYDALWRGEPMNEILALEHSGARWVLLNSKDIDPLATYVRRHGRLAQRIPDSARVRMMTGAGLAIDELWERR